MFIFVWICDGICRDTEVHKTEEGFFFFLIPMTLYLRLTVTSAMFVVYGKCGSNGENRTIKPGNPSLQDSGSHIMHQQHVNANFRCIPKEHNVYKTFRNTTVPDTACVTADLRPAQPPNPLRLTPRLFF